MTRLRRRGLLDLDQLDGVLDDPLRREHLVLGERIRGLLSKRRGRWRRRGHPRRRRLLDVFRARMKVTGESYQVARLAVLAERGLSPTTPTSRNGLKRKQALLDADYPPEVLGISPEPVWVWAPQPKHPPVEERVRGRVQPGGRNAGT